MHKFIPACHLENVDALNTAAQKKNPLIKMSCSNAAVQRQGGKTINGPLSVMVLAVLTQAPSVQQYGGPVISIGRKSPPF